MEKEKKWGRQVAGRHVVYARAWGGGGCKASVPHSFPFSFLLFFSGLGLNAPWEEQGTDLGKCHLTPEVLLSFDVLKAIGVETPRRRKLTRIRNDSPMGRKVKKYSSIICFAACVDLLSNCASSSPLSSPLSVTSGLARLTECPPPHLTRRRAGDKPIVPCRSCAVVEADWHR